MANPKMEVRLVQQLRGDFKIVIYLQSERKPQLRTLGELNPGVASGTTNLLNRVSIVAGLVAERQNMEHGDNHSLETCARIARELFIEAAREYGQRKADLQRSVQNLVEDPELLREDKTAHVSATSD
ncbi:hypothetical protein AIIMSPlu_033 [Pseudomonas phage AIIMS-Plu-RaNi]|nr:hypothetical protein AIIMSPlu_033 [Pseudomonas phage AIIMS-Plu-RaNi]